MISIEGTSVFSILGGTASSCFSRSEIFAALTALLVVVPLTDGETFYKKGLTCLALHFWSLCVIIWPKSLALDGSHLGKLDCTRIGRTLVPYLCSFCITSGGVSLGSSTFRMTEERFGQGLLENRLEWLIHAPVAVISDSRRQYASAKN